MSNNSSAELESLRLLLISLSKRVTVLEEEYGQRVSLDGDVLNSGDTAWLLAATALVFFMTIPGSSNPDRKCPRSVRADCIVLLHRITSLYFVFDER